MIKSLEIVKGGVAKKNLNPILTHLRIKQGWVTSTNGRLTISCPIPDMDELDIVVPADRFTRAIKAAKEPKFKITDTGRLSITGKGFRALLPLLDGIGFPMPVKRGDRISPRAILNTLKRLSPFIGDDATRAWCNGVLLYKGYAYATNNTILVKSPVDWGTPAINLPEYLVNELVRLDRSIEEIITNGTTITFKLADSVWLNSSLASTKWPNADSLFSGSDYSALYELPTELKKSILTILPFCPDPKFPRIHFDDGGVSTDPGSHEASIEIEGLGIAPTTWRAEPMLLMLEHSKGDPVLADFSPFPGPCPFQYADGLQGLIVGLRE